MAQAKRIYIFVDQNKWELIFISSFHSRLTLKKLKSLFAFLKFYIVPVSQITICLFGLVLTDDLVTNRHIVVSVTNNLFPSLFYKIDRLHVP